ncbi:MAG: hypothetical protein ACP5N2_05730 [Candidatus Nanoarchaeia archaeon]
MSEYGQGLYNANKGIGEIITTYERNKRLNLQKEKEGRGRSREEMFKENEEWSTAILFNDALAKFMGYGINKQDNEFADQGTTTGTSIYTIVPLSETLSEKLSEANFNPSEFVKFMDENTIPYWDPFHELSHLLICEKTLMQRGNFNAKQVTMHKDGVKLTYSNIDTGQDLLVHSANEYVAVFDACRLFFAKEKM